MKKGKFWLILILIIIAAIVFLWVIKGSVISGYISKQMKTKVSISSVSVSSKHLKMKNFRIKNPRGTKNKYAFNAKKIEVDYKFSNLFSKPAVIDEIVIEDILLDIECKNPLCSKNNWTAIINKIHAYEKKKKPTKEYLIKKLVMKNLNVDIWGMGLNFGKKQTKQISYIEFNNINSRDGFPTQQLIAAIFRSAGLKEFLKGILEQKSTIEKFLSPFKELGENERHLQEEDAIYN